MDIKKVYSYHYIKPRRIDMLPNMEVSYNIEHYDEDDEIRFGFGLSNDEHKSVKIVDINFAWLSIIFHIVSTSECNNSIVSHVRVAKNDMSAVKEIAKEYILHYLESHPKKLLHLLEVIHDSSREQGHLEVISHLKDVKGIKH